MELLRLKQVSGRADSKFENHSWFMTEGQSWRCPVYRLQADTDTAVDVEMNL